MGLFDKRKKKYENGDEYIGKLKGGKPDGFGTMHYANGDVYEGDWVAGVRCGRGKFVRRGDDWEDTYEGSWFNDERSGQGTLRLYRTDRSLETYEGHWEHNRLNGKGKERSEYYDSGTTYEYDGEYVDSSKEGYGVSRLISDITEIYEGHWSKNKFGGQGTFTINEQIVTGIFDDYSRITNATVRYPNGDVYEGDVIMDDVLKEGEKCSGRMTYADGDVYEGEWLWTGLYKGAPDGWGTMTFYGNYLPYTGPWKNGEHMSLDEYFGRRSTTDTVRHEPASVSTESSESQIEPAEETVTAAKPDLPRMTIATIGGRETGKTALTAAISKVLSVRYKTEYKPVTVQELDNLPEEQKIHGSIDTSVIEYRTDTRHYTHIDCPGRYFKNALCGAQMADVCILVISAEWGVTPETRDFMELYGRRSVVFLETGRVDDDGLMEMISEDITMLGFEDIIVGSAWKALEDPYGPDGDAILELMDRIEKTIPASKRDTEGSLALPIHKAKTFSGKGPVIFGLIESGTLRAGDALELVGGYNNVFTVTAKEIRYFDKDVESACAGEYVGVLLEGEFPKKIKRGQLLATPGSRPCYEHIKVLAAIEKRSSFYFDLRIDDYYGANALCWSGLTSEVGKMLGARLPTKEEGYPIYGDTTYRKDEIIRVIDLFFIHLLPFRKDDRVIFIEHNRPVGFGSILEADNVDPETFCLQFSENASAQEESDK